MSTKINNSARIKRIGSNHHFLLFLRKSQNSRAMPGDGCSAKSAMDGAESFVGSTSFRSSWSCSSEFIFSGRISSRIVESTAEVRVIPGVQSNAIRILHLSGSIRDLSQGLSL